MRLFKANNHRRWQRRLSAYVDGQLTPKEQATMEAHLAGCQACRHELADLRSVVSLLRSVPQAAVPRSFALRQVPPAARAWWLRYETPLRFATATAAVLLVALVAGDALLKPPTTSLPNPAAAPETETQRSAAGGPEGATATTPTPAGGAASLDAAPTPSPEPPAAMAAESEAQDKAQEPGPGVTSLNLASPENGEAKPVVAAPESAENLLQPQEPERNLLWAQAVLAAALALLLVLTLLLRRARLRLFRLR